MDKLGRYELRGLLGKGGMGVVYRAHDTRYGRTVALKVMSEEAASNPEFEEWFRRERDLVIKLNSPHIVPIHEYGEIDGRPYLDMRFVDGNSLSGMVKKYGPCTLDVAIEILDQAAFALDDTHREGVVHRDVKPGNLLIDRKGFVYLSDFGISVAAETPGGDDGRILGSFPYMSPERFKGRADGSSDTYGLACVMYYALTGSPPFHADTFEQWKYQHAHTEPQPIPGVRAEVNEVIAWGMAKNPDDRPRSSRAWTRALRKAAESTGSLPAATAPRPRPVAPPPDPEPERRSILPFVFLVILAVAAGALLALAVNAAGN